MIDKTIAVHAAKRKPRLDEIGEEFEEVSARITGHAWADLPLGAIVATARICRVYRTEELFGEDGTLAPTGLELFVEERHSPELEFMLGNYEPARYAWALADVVRLAEPVPCSGKQGFWTLDEATATKVAERTLGGCLGRL